MKKQCLRVDLDSSYLNIIRLVPQVSPDIELMRFSYLLLILLHSSSMIVVIVVADNVDAPISRLL